MTKFIESERSGERLPTASHRASKASQLAGMLYGMLVLHKTYSAYRIANASLCEIAEIIENIARDPA